MKIIINLEEAFSAFIPKSLEILSFHQSSLPLNLNGKIEESLINALPVLPHHHAARELPFINIILIIVVDILFLVVDPQCLCNDESPIFILHPSNFVWYLSMSRRMNRTIFQKPQTYSGGVELI